MTIQYNDYLRRVLTATAASDTREFLFWRVVMRNGQAEIVFYVDGSDIFSFDESVADAEPITPATVVDFESAICDVRAATEGDATYGPLLYVARLRKQRPINKLYPTDSRLWPLFDACGPEHPEDTPAASHPSATGTGWVDGSVNGATVTGAGKA